MTRAFIAVLFVLPLRVGAQVLVENQPQGVRGGRIIAITVSQTNASVAIAASPTGGLFKTTDGSTTWAHLDGLPANRMWDVQIDPNNANHVLATVVVDTHKPTHAGLWRSTDGGATWTQATGYLAGSCDATDTPNYGRQIFFGPGTNIFVGSDCGLAVSHDGGATWSQITVAPGRPGVWSVAARSGTGGAVIVDICTSGGPRRSTDGGATFGATPAAPPYPIDICSIAQSPTEQNVVFGASKSGGTGYLWESDDGGATWTQRWTWSTQRFPWVRTTVPPGAPAGRFDIYFHPGDDVFRQRCTTGGTGPRCMVQGETLAACNNAVDDDGDGLVNEGCPAVYGAEGGATQCKNALDDDNDGVVNDGCGIIEYVGGGHDVGGIAVDASGCPAYMGSDWGVTRSTDCGVTWTSKYTTPIGSSIYDIAATVLPTHTDIYFGTQDNHIWASWDNGQTWPWNKGAEGFWLQAPQKANAHGVIVTGTVCYGCVQLSWQDHGAGEDWWPRSADQNRPAAGGPPFAVQGGVGPAPFLQLNNGTFWMRDISGTWRSFTPAVLNLATAELWVSGPPHDPTAYVVTEAANVRRLQRVAGFGASGSGPLTVTPTSSTLAKPYIWVPDDNPFKYPYVIGVDPNWGARLIAADATSSRMLVTGDSGKTWTPDTMLTRLVTGSGKLLFDAPYLGMQAHVIRYNPTNAAHILVGTEAAGIIETCDAGRSWHVIVGSERSTAVSDFAFDSVRRQVHVATYGRGLWRIDYPQRPIKFVATLGERPPRPLVRAGRPRVALAVPQPLPDPCWEPPQPPSVTIAAPPRLSIRVVVDPAGDPGRVALALDGAALGPPVPNGFWTGWRMVSAGQHVVTAIAVPAVQGSVYQLTIGGDCSAGGAVTAAAGLPKTCIVTATHQ
ncbi:MAG TPA: hypothetical protein VGJ80_13415 [Gemmatimonadales bacterium]|jgi:photosystem II stability/assembly factor-like uncharacterized protein